MINQKILRAFIVSIIALYPLTMNLNQAYATHKEKIIVTSRDGNQLKFDFDIDKEATYKDVMAILEKKWNQFGVLVHAGVEIPPEVKVMDYTKRGYSTEDILTELRWIPYPTIPTADKLEKMAKEEYERKNDEKGNLFTGLAAVKLAMQDANWAKARERFNRLGEQTKGNFLAEAMDAKIKRQINRELKK